MSAEEDTELRDLVAQSLESKGVLGKIRAQLRASVFLVLDEQDNSENKIPLSSPNLKKFLNTTEGRLVTGLVREFLEFFDLDFTIAVFDPESSFSDRYQGRNNLGNELNLHDTEKFSSKPLLLEVVQRLLQGGNTTTPKQPPSANDTQPQVKNNSWQNGPISPRSSSPSSASKDEDDQSRSELMISAGFKSDDDNDMKPSKIPQRIKDDKPKSTSHSLASENGLDLYNDGNLSTKDKSLSDSRKEQSGRGSPDRTLGSDDDDDIFNEFMSKQKPSYQPSTTRKEINGDKKPLDKLDSGPKSQGVLSSLKGAPSLSGGSGLGSLRDAPPLTGTTKSIAGKDLSKSPDWNDLADIDNRINRLGFGEERSTHSQDYDYEDDFQPSSEHSLTEEIEEQLSSNRSNSSKADLLTTDHTVSHASDSGLDYAEDILDDDF